MVENNNAAQSAPPPVIPPVQNVPPPPPPPGQVHVVPPAENEGAEIVARVKEFQKFKPPVFKGEKDPIVAKHWILKLEKLFDLMKTSSVERATFAAFMLEEEAEYWWKATKTVLNSRHAEITWEVFIEAFKEQYIPETAQRMR